MENRQYARMRGQIKKSQISCNTSSEENWLMKESYFEGKNMHL